MLTKGDKVFRSEDTTILWNKVDPLKVTLFVWRLLQ